MRVTVEDGTARVVIDDGPGDDLTDEPGECAGCEPDDDPEDDLDGELVAKDWAAWNAAHGRTPGKTGTHRHGKAHAKPASAFAEAQQTLQEEREGGKPTKAELANAHNVHEAHLAHLAHLAHEKAEQAQAGGTGAATPVPAAAGPAGRPAGSPAAVAAKSAAAPQRYVLGVAYQPGPDPRIARGQDGGRDYFTEAELEKACFSYLASGSPVIGISHLDGTTGAATVVESYIYRNPEPWDIGNGITVAKGTWLIGAILDDKSWEMAQAGKLNGFSPQGTARRRRPQPGGS